MMTIMKARAMTPSWAIENATPDERASTVVAAAVPGPHTTNAAVPKNSAVSLRYSRLRTMDPPDARNLWRAGGYKTAFGTPEQCLPSLRPGGPGVNRASGQVCADRALAVPGR